MFGKKKTEKKDLGLSQEQSQIIIQNTYTSELLADNNYNVVAKEAFKSNSDAYSVINKLASDVAKLNFRVFRVNKTDQKKTYLNTHPFLELIKRPNMDRGKYEYLYEFVMYFLLNGQAFQQKTLVAGTPQALYVPTPNTIGYWLEGGKQKGWYFDYNGRKIKYEKEELSMLMIPDPLDRMRGFSPLKAASYEIDGNNVSNQWNFSMIKNGARPSGILTTDQVLSDNTIKRLKSLLKGFWSGEFNAGESQILDGGMKWHQMSLSQKDMDNKEYQAVNSRKIAQVLQIPSQVLGFPEASTFANFEEANKYYAENTLLNMAQRIVDEWNLWLMPDYGDNIFVEINKDDIEALQENRDMLSDRTIKQYDSGIITRGEARQKLGYGESDEDKVYKFKTSELLLNAETGEIISPVMAQNAIESDEMKTVGGIFEDIEMKLNQIDVKKKEYKASLQTNVIISVLNSLDSEELHEDVKDYYYALIAEEGIRVFSEILEVDQTYSMTDRITKYIEEDVLKNCVAITDETLREKLSLQLLEGSEANESISQLMDRVNKVFEDQYFISDVPNHAEVIARTEALSASSYAQDDAYKESGVVESTTWKNPKDGRERWFHGSMNNQTRALGEMFITGEGVEMEFPRDGRGGARNAIQCRCGRIPNVIGQKSKFDTEEKQYNLIESNIESAESYIEDMLKNYDKAFRKQRDNVIKALEEVGNE